jgi:hypothetical protein
VALALLFLGVRFLQGVPLLGNTYTLVARFESAAASPKARRSRCEASRWER